MFHQNNLKSGNYGSMIRVFCRLSGEARKMSDKYITRIFNFKTLQKKSFSKMIYLKSQLITLQTSNLLLLIRCYTKYIIEIENETALLEQLNFNSSANEKETSNQLSGISYKNF